MSDCNCQKEHCEIISCEKFDVEFSDRSQDVNVGLEDNSEGLNIGIVDVGTTLINNTTVVLRATTEYWDSKRDLVSQRNVFYLYLDHISHVNERGELVYTPGLKIGDGLAYLIDLPFIENSEIFIKASDVERWDNKWRGYMAPSNPENLIFTTE